MLATACLRLSTHSKPLQPDREPQFHDPASNTCLFQAACKSLFHFPSQHNFTEKSGREGQLVFLFQIVYFRENIQGCSFLLSQQFRRLPSDLQFFEQDTSLKLCAPVINSLKLRDGKICIVSHSSSSAAFASGNRTASLMEVGLWTRRVESHSNKPTCGMHSQEIRKSHVGVDGIHSYARPLPTSTRT